MRKQYQAMTKHLRAPDLLIAAAAGVLAITVMCALHILR